MAAGNSKGLTTDRLKQLIHYDSDTGVFTRIASRCTWTLGKITPTPMPSGHLTFYVDGKLHLAHRLAWLYVHGCLPEYIDHINGNPGDNRICNLREATHSQNMQNSRPRSHSRSGIRNVSVQKSSSGKLRWRAQVSAGGVMYRKWFGDSPEEAIAWAERKRAELHGDFSYKNQ